MLSESQGTELGIGSGKIPGKAGNWSKRFLESRKISGMEIPRSYIQDKGGYTVCYLPYLPSN